MTAAELCEYCSEFGHDVRRVVDVPELGPGSEDEREVRYALRNDRLVVTYDADYLPDPDTIETVGVLFQPDEAADPYQTARIIDHIANLVSQEAVTAHEKAFHLTDEWLE